MADLISSSKSYQDLLVRLKNQIRTAQVRAGVAVNQELVLLYWGIGKEILTRQEVDGWGTRVIDRLAKDLRSEFPGMQGLSPHKRLLKPRDDSVYPRHTRIRTNDRMATSGVNTSTACP